MWKKIVSKVAPILGSALGGPMGGAATRFLSKKLLGESASETDLATYIENASPEQLIKVRESDHEFKAAMRKLDIDVMEMERQDRQDARALAQESTILPHVIMSAVYTVMYGLVLYLLLSGRVDIDQEHMGLVMAVIGILTAAQGQILNFWFGSSSGSKEKDRRLKS